MQFNKVIFGVYEEQKHKKWNRIFSVKTYIVKDLTFMRCSKNCVQPLSPELTPSENISRYSKEIATYFYALQFGILFNMYE